MVEEGIVLGHKISRNGIEVDKAKIEVISKLSPSTSVKGVQSFLGLAGFYQRFIKDFSKVNPLCKILEKNAKFHFNDDYRKGSEKQVADYLSPLEEEGRSHDGLEINYSFPDEKLLAISIKEVPWFANLANFLVSGIIPDELSSNQRKKLKRECQDYYWDEPYLFGICMNGVITRCVREEEQGDILGSCHSSPYGGHHDGERTIAKVLSHGFYWPTLYKDASHIVKTCDECQQAGGISKKNEMFLTSILEIDIFNSLPNNEARSVAALLKKIFLQDLIGPRILIMHYGLIGRLTKHLSECLHTIANLWVAHLNGLDEFRYPAYESSSLYKEKMKYLHDKHIWNKEFKAGDLILVFNSRLRIFPVKLKSNRSGMFEIIDVTPFGALILKNKNNKVFRVNDHRLKH
ncbi:uncharacterized protein [Nicotiana sylvestris]|uniref:uncharacterized protein n=1 Tax=Nicotiana sylvestris TaxID=4096 RepID=UPI00388C5863